MGKPITPRRLRYLFLYSFMLREVVGSNCLGIPFIEFLTARSLISVEPLMGSVLYLRMILVINAELLTTSKMFFGNPTVTSKTTAKQLPSQSKRRGKSVVKANPKQALR